MTSPSTQTASSGAIHDVNLVNGAVAGLLGIVIAAVVIAVLMSEDVVNWYRR